MLTLKKEIAEKLKTDYAIGPNHLKILEKEINEIANKSIAFSENFQFDVMRPIKKLINTRIWCVPERYLTQNDFDKLGD